MQGPGPGQRQRQRWGLGQGHEGHEGGRDLARREQTRTRTRTRTRTVRGQGQGRGRTARRGQHTQVPDFSAPRARRFFSRIPPSNALTPQARFQLISGRTRLPPPCARTAVARARTRSFERRFPRRNRTNPRGIHVHDTRGKRGCTSRAVRGGEAAARRGKRR